MWVSVDGRITTDSYKELMAEIDEVLKKTSPISFLVNLQDLEGIEIGAIVSDLAPNLMKFLQFRKVALVGQEKWVQKAASLKNPFPMKIRAYSHSEEGQAWKWLTES